MSSILVAEDNPLNFELARDVLQRDGHTIHWARDGVEAIDRLRSLYVDLVLLDLHLPTIDGMQVLYTIRADPALRGMRVLVVSADAMPGVREWVLREGADAFLAKPFKVKELVSEVGHLLSRSTEYISPSA